jgi:two-component sensor histidine kinase
MKIITLLGISLGVGSLFVLLLAAKPVPEFKKGESSRLLQQAQAIEKRARLNSDSMLLAEAYRLYGIADRTVGAYTEARQNFHNALHILEPKGDSPALAAIYTLLSENPEITPISKAQKRYISQALGIYQRIKNKNKIAETYIKIGNYHSHQGLVGHQNRINYDSANFYYHSAEKLALQIQDSVIVADANIFLGELLLSQKDTLCFRHFEKALFFLGDERKGHDWGIIHTYIHQATAFLYFDQYKECLDHLKKAEQLYQLLPEENILIYLRVLATYHQLYLKTRQYKLAHSYLFTYHRYTIQQYTMEKEAVVTLIQEKYEVDKTERRLITQQNEIAQANEYIKRNKLVIWVISVGLITAVVIGYTLFRLYKEKQRLSELNAQLVREQGHRVNNHLQAAGSLLALQSQQITDSNAKSAVLDTELRMHAIALIQRQLYHSGIAKEVYLPDYITELIHNILTACGYHLIEQQIHIDPVSLHSDKVFSLGLIINELVTNACKYAFPNHVNPILTLSCWVIENHLHLTVSDNGHGFDFESKNLENSLGLQLIKMQALQLYAHYSFESGENATRMTFALHFPI